MLLRFNRPQMSTPSWTTLIEHCTKCYEYLLNSVFKSLRKSTSKLCFVQWSSNQLTKEYNMDSYSLPGRNRGCEAGGEPAVELIVVLGSQALHEQHLDVDLQLGCVEQVFE